MMCGMACKARCGVQGLNRGRPRGMLRTSICLHPGGSACALLCQACASICVSAPAVVLSAAPPTSLRWSSSFLR